MMTDFEKQLQSQLKQDMESLNKDVLDEIMKAPFEPEKERSKISIFTKKRVLSMCASVMILFVAVFAMQPNDLGTGQYDALSTPYVVRGVNTVGLSIELEEELAGLGDDDIMEVVVFSVIDQENFEEMLTLERPVSLEDLEMTKFKVSNKEVSFEMRITKENIMDLSSVAFFDVVE